TRALRPTSAAIERFAEHGIDIERIVQNAGGNLLEILRQIGQQAQGLEQFDLGQAMAELFGTYQFNRLNAALAGVTEGYGGLADESSQTAKAIAVSQQSISENAQAAQEELNRWQQSAPGKFKRALEAVKAEIVQMGMPFLEVGAVVMGFVQKLLGWFNDLPSAVKKFAMIGVVAAGLVGPLVMMTGIFGNFIGTIGKGITSIM